MDDPSAAHRIMAVETAWPPHHRDSVTNRDPLCRMASGDGPLDARLLDLTTGTRGPAARASPTPASSSALTKLSF